MSCFTRSPHHLQIYENYFGSLLRSCTKSKSLRQGKQIHAQMLVSGLLVHVESLQSKLLGVYACFGYLHYAEHVFVEMTKPSVFAWNWMILGSAFHGSCPDAIHWFSMMQRADVFANRYTFPSVLKAIIGLMEIEKGKQVHCSVITRGFQLEVSVANSLVDMYAKCRDLRSACQVFDEMLHRDVATWTIIICGYAQSGRLRDSKRLFSRMRSEVEPNEFTWNAMVAACAESGDCRAAFDFFNQMKKEGVEPNEVTWNAIIAGFCRNDKESMALKLFAEIVVLGLKPNAVTVASVLPACGNMGMLGNGKQIHSFSYRCGLERNVHVITALIDMYAKCGSVSNARNVFDQLPEKTVPCWNAMIGCYGKHGQVEMAFELFEQMQKLGLDPNQVTFTTILSSCSHSGLVEKGLEVFSLMRDNYTEEITQEHYACMVDLLGRSGWLIEAYELVRSMPMPISESVVGAFLGGCRVHGRTDLSEKLANEMIVKMGYNNSSCFMNLSNIYATAGKWEEVEDVRKVMKVKRVHKKPGCSWVEMRNVGV